VFNPASHRLCRPPSCPLVYQPSLPLQPQLRLPALVLALPRHQMLLALTTMKMGLMMMKMKTTKSLTLTEGVMGMILIQPCVTAIMSDV